MQSKRPWNSERYKESIFWVDRGFMLINSKIINGIPCTIYSNKFKKFTMIDEIMISGVIPKVISANVKLYSRNIKILHNDVTLLDRDTDQYLTRQSDKESYYAMEKKIVQCLNLEIDSLVKKGRL